MQTCQALGTVCSASAGDRAAAVHDFQSPILRTCVCDGVAGQVELPERGQAPQHAQPIVPHARAPHVQVREPRERAQRQHARVAQLAQRTRVRPCFTLDNPVPLRERPWQGLGTPFPFPAKW